MMENHIKTRQHLKSLIPYEEEENNNNIAYRRLIHDVKQ